MKYIILLTSFILVSCSTTPLRGPAGTSDSICSNGMKSFFESDESSLTKNDLLNKDLISQKDLNFLEGSIISKTFSENSVEREQMEISYLLIKKQYPDFAEEQVIEHYRLLKVYCGM